VLLLRRSPDDPELGDYWAWRRRKAPLPINRTALRLYRAQNGRCAICKTTLLAASQRPQTPRDWEQWLATTRKTIDFVWNTAISDAAEPRLVHLHCNTTRQPPGLA
jgi:RNA-directed DNA polymerase